MLIQFEYNMLIYIFCENNEDSRIRHLQHIGNVFTFHSFLSYCHNVRSLFVCQNALPHFENILEDLKIRIYGNDEWQWWRQKHEKTKVHKNLEFSGNSVRVKMRVSQESNGIQKDRKTGGKCTNQGRREARISLGTGCMVKVANVP